MYDMEYTRLGSTGLTVSQLCLGTAQFSAQRDGQALIDREQAHKLLDAAFEMGVNFIDTANTYGDPAGTSEKWIGEWLQDHDRDEVVIASKVYWSAVSEFSENLSRKNIRAEIEGTLERLGTEYLDIYYIHRWDDETPIEETMKTLSDLVREGKVHYLGASSMAAWKLTKALWNSEVHGLEPFSITQPRFNPAYRDEVSEYLEVCSDQGLAVCPYSPLERGFLTGKYERNRSPPEDSRAEIYGWDDEWTDRQWAVLDAICSVGEELDASPAQVTLRWLMDRPQYTCVPIIGARKIHQLEENVQSVDLSLSSSQRELITEAYDKTEHE